MHNLTPHVQKKNNTHCATVTSRIYIKSLSDTSEIYIDTHNDTQVDRFSWRNTQKAAALTTNWSTAFTREKHKNLAIEILYIYERQVVRVLPAHWLLFFWSVAARSPRARITHAKFVWLCVKYTRENIVCVCVCKNRHLLACSASALLHAYVPYCCSYSEVKGAVVQFNILFFFST